MRSAKIAGICLWLLCLGIFAYAENGFRAQFAGQQTIDQKNVLAITFSEKLDTRQDLDSYISLFVQKDLAVEGAWVLSSDPQVVYFSNIKPDTQYRIKIYKGLKSASGRRLAAAREFKVKTRYIEPAINFDTKGFILASKLSKGLPVNALNIDKADIDFFRVKPNFYDEFSRVFGRSDKMEYYENKKLHQYADLVYSGRWDLDIQKDLRTPVNIPVTHIKELAVPGIYFAVLKGAGHYNYSNSSTWFTISDLGLHIKTYKDMVQIHVQSLETARPLKGVEIEGFDKKGRSGIRIKTDEKGVARITGKIENVEYLVARHKNNITFVSLALPAIDMSEFKTATEPFRSLELFVYGPRDLYRPGETVTFDGLLRNQDGEMTTALPITAQVFQPDGRMVYEFKFKPAGLNHYHYQYKLPAGSVTGQWQIRFKQASSKFKPYTFIVSEFLPERMKLAIKNQEKKTDIIGLNETPMLELQGDYLYGAPASGIKADAKGYIRPARELFKEKWPGYEFGDITATLDQYFESDTIVLNPKGQGKIRIDNEWNDVRTPLRLNANVSLYDSGGRPVVRSKAWQIWPADTLVGIRSLSDDGRVAGDSTVQFEIIVVDSSGNRLKADNLKGVVIREHREYYWEFRHGRWQWQFTSQSYPIDSFKLNVPQNGSATVNVPVKWGGYRLEITHHKTGLATSNRVWAGWHPDSASAAGGANRPDRVSLVLDKPVYQSHDTVNVTVKAPEGGSGYLFVEANTNLLTIPVDIPVQGKTISFKMEPSWNRHDLYVSALIVRDKKDGVDAVEGRLPKRAMGLIHLPLDRDSRQLSVDITAPEKIEPNQTMKVSVDIRHQDDLIPSNAWVTVSAVDEGILNLTGFKTPEPHAYFFQPRKYAAKSHDVYQKLIQANKGAWANLRFGGDAPNLTRGGDKPSTDVQIVAISKQAVKVDETGRARFDLDIPDFNGSVRLMAVAHTDQDYGSGQKEMTIAAPLVTQITMPRFLAMGDQASLAIDLHNLSGTRQSMDLSLDVTGPVMLTDKTREKVVLDPAEKATLIFDVLARQQLGLSDIRLMVSGLSVEGIEKEIDRSWQIETRPAYPAMTQRFKKMLKPNERLALGVKELGSMVENTIDVQAIISTSPPINVMDHVRKLNAYPYGCLEQTTSGIFPHVILSSADFKQLGVSREDFEKTEDKIKIGIQRLMEKQKSRGGFGLWSAQAPENHWLTCYAADFLLHASQAGYEVPQTSLNKALERLKTYAMRPSSIHAASYTDKKSYRAAVRAYAAFVLSRIQAIRMGDARSVCQSIEKDLEGSLAYVHTGLALILTGDLNTGPKVLELAVPASRDTNRYYGDYGSNLRDWAMAYFLVSEFYSDSDNVSQFMLQLQDELDSREYLSTQENNALVLAGSISLKQKQQPWKARIKTGSMVNDLDYTGLKQLSSMDGESAQGFEIENTSDKDLYASVTLAGYPDQEPEPVSHTAEIERRYLSLSGNPMTTDALQQLKSGDRLLVELSFSSDKRMANGLIVDLLPAGLELEDPHLSGSILIDEIKVDDKTVEQWQQRYDILHTEYRDDRFVAAVDIHSREMFRLFYSVRVVSPGRFRVPPPLIEDMYKPYIRGIGKTIPIMTIKNP